jgi:hypothetical protein
MRHDGNRRRNAAASWIAIGAGLMGPCAFADEPETSVAQPCLHRSNIKKTKILDAGNILFYTRQNMIYNNVLPKECPTVRRNTLLNYPANGGALCAGNKFAVLQQIGTSYMPTVFCPLGMFVPISEDEAAELIALTEEEPRRRRRGARNMIETERVELPPAEPVTDSPEAAEPAGPRE